MYLVDKIYMETITDNMNGKDHNKNLMTAINLNIPIIKLKRVYDQDEEGTDTSELKLQKEFHDTIVDGMSNQKTNERSEHHR